MASALEQLLLPAECLLCRALLPYASADDLVCGVCRQRWRPVVRPWCERCGQPEPRFGPCRQCATWPAPFSAARSAVWLEGGARDAAHALKYGGLPRVAVDLAVVMARRLPRPDDSAVLVPIPLGRKRLAARGYNQSERLARALARIWGIGVAATLLVRTRDTVTQTALTPTARLANVAGAFQLRIADFGLGETRRHAHSAIHIPQSTIILVDDVFTTGATLAAAAAALVTAGARRITAVTFGRAVIPDFI